MRRVVVLFTIVLVGGLLSTTAASWQPGAAPAQRVVEVDKLKDNLFMLRGGGGNTVVFVMSNGVAVVDTKNPGWGQPILDKIKEITSKPVTLIINTHTHGDHVSGNVEFPPTVDVVTHANTADNMKRMQSPPGFKPAATATNIFEANNGRGLPKRTFTDRLTIGKGADQIDLHYFGRGHTNGDAWVVFPALRMMHSGDIFPGKQVPIIDSNNGGSGVEYGESLAKAAAASKNIEGIITGHSTVMTVAELSEFAAFMRDFREFVRAGKKAGQTVDQIAESWKLSDKYQGYAAPQAPRVRINVEIIYKELN